MRKLVTEIILLLKLYKQQDLPDAILQERIRKILEQYKEIIKKELK